MVSAVRVILSPLSPIAPQSRTRATTEAVVHVVELPEAADFRETTSLTVEELSDGIRCFTVRPLHSQRWGLQLLAGSLLFAALSASLPPPLIVVAVLFALGATARAAFSVRLESLLVMEGIGLQLTTRFTTGREKVVFVETSAVSEVCSGGRRHARRLRYQSTLSPAQMFISEAVRLDCCFFYMACLLHGDDLCHQPRCAWLGLGLGLG